jgi:protein involved in polysaccharide export with SLBB domain
VLGVPALSILMFKRFRFFFPLVSLAVALYAQTPTSSQNGVSENPENSTPLDCSDPLIASTAGCVAQQQQEIGQQITATTPGQNGSLPYVPNRNYSDLEQWSRMANEQGMTRQVLLPPEPLTEFQKFIASTTGQILPIYGANLFRNVPSTFAPLNIAPVPADYVIGPDDVLRIRIWGQINFQANVRVDRSGDIYIPEVGPVHVAGLPYSALDAHLRNAINHIYRNFGLSVDVGQIRSIQVYITGEARRPGMYTVSSLSTLVDALFASGGPSVAGSLRHIELRRGNAVVTDFDLYNLLIRGDKSKDAKLLPGDVIFIPPVGPQAAVTGSVRNPGIYELRAGESLESLLADAGGVTSVASEARVSIERINDHRAREAMEVAYDSHGLTTPVANGDLIRVYSIVPMYQKTVTLRGNVANPGRFAWHPGMRISDLIPDKDSLITRNYWWRRAQLGLPAPEFEPADGLSDMRQPSENHLIEMNLSPRQGWNSAVPYGQYGTPQSESNSTQEGQYRAQQQDQDETQQDQDENQQGQSGPQQSGQSGQQQNQYGMQRGQPGYLQNQNLTAQQRAGSAALGAEQEMTPQGTTMPSSQRTQVRLLAPEIDWDYAVIERLNPDTLETTLVPFDLGKLVLQHDASQDLELQPGDVVTIFSAADIREPIAQQTKLVRLEGEFVHAGVYSVKPGETLRQLVKRAGGLTSNAYLYGSEFTRESTRAVQQTRIDEYVQTLSMEIQRSNLALAGSPGASSAALASGSLAQTSEHDFLASLRRIRATGRIVLTFKPGSRGVNSLPDITLENGDYFAVPHVPAVVNVVGAVYDESSFLYTPERTAGEFLRLAGGPNRVADWHHEFIIRADGEVVSRGRNRTIWSGNEFDSLRMNPGDTIVVPEKAFRPSALVGVLDWSQLFSQFALGASALSVIH